MNNLWHYSDLTAYVGAPNAANGSAITAVYSPISGTTSIYYLSSDQHVQQIWMGTTGGWNHDDFTAYVGAPLAAAGSSLEAFYNPVNPLGPTTEVYYVGTNQHVYQFWLGQGSWHIGDISAYVGAPNAVSGSPITAVYSSASSTVSLYYLSSNQHIQQIWMGTAGSWSYDDFTAYVGAPLAATGSTLASVYNPTNPIGPTTEVYYIGTDQHIYQFWLLNNLWHISDFSPYVGAPNAVYASPIAATYNALSKTDEVYYVSADQHMQQVWMGTTGSWSHDDFTVYLGTPVVAPPGSYTFAGGNFTLTQGSTVNFGSLILAMQGDGNLVLYQNGSFVWASNTSGQNCGVNQCYAAFQGDGNFVVYNGSTPIWNSQTYGNPGAQLVLSGQAPYIEIVGSNQSALWLASNIITGQLMVGGSGRSGITVTLTGTTGLGATISLSTTSSSNGNYSFSVPIGGTYTVVPFLSGYTFNPASVVFNGLAGSQVANLVGSVQTATVSQNCTDISGTWTDGNYTYSISETFGAVSGTDTLILPYGSVVWTLSGQTTDGVNYSMRVYNPNPTTTDFGIPDQEDDFTLTNPTCTSATATLTKRITGTGSSFLGGGSPSQTGWSTTWSRQAAQTPPPTTADITVIAWVDGSKITLPTPQTPDLAIQLNAPLYCQELLANWARGVPQYLNGQADNNYANDWLLIHSPNSQPLSHINPDAELDAGDFRLFNRFKILSNGNISKPTALVNLAVPGSTPDPCGVLPNASAQTHTNIGFIGIDSAGKGVAQLAEGRLGTLGQAINKTINGGTTPWIWSVIEFDSSGNVIIPIDHAMFPTYSIYLNGSLVQTCPQSDPQSFIAKSDSYQRTPSQIPVSSGLTSCHN